MPYGTYYVLPELSDANVFQSRRDWRNLLCASAWPSVGIRMLPC